MSDRLVLRPMAALDLDAVSAIEAAAGLPARSRDALARELSAPRVRSIVLAVDAAIGGSASLWLAPDLAHITTVAVPSELRRRGYGRLLVAALLAIAQAEGAEAATLESRASNTAARALYASHGFAVAGQRPRYYADGEGAVVMTTALFADPEFAVLLETIRARLPAAHWELDAVRD